MTSIAIERPDWHTEEDEDMRLHQINLEIAWRLGMYVYNYDKDHPSQCYYTLMTETGASVFGEVNEYYEQFRLEWVKAGYYAGERQTYEKALEDVPQWTTNLNFARVLVSDLWYQITGDKDGHKAVVRKSSRSKIAGKSRGLQKTPELALCLAWLDLMDTEDF